ncbi:MAG: cytochrome c oxidase subunit II [Chloroflexota bacterium]
MNRVAGIFVAICVASIVLGILIGANNVNSWFPEASHQAVEVDFLFKFMLIASVFVFLIVHVYLLYFATRFRRRRTDTDASVGEPIHGNTQLEIVWSILPAIFLVFLAALCFGVWDEMHTAKKHEMVVEVVGHQFFFEFRYPQYGQFADTNDLHLPTNTPILFKETAPSSDVLHSFWIPEFRVKQDIVPGYTTYLRVQTKGTGDYPVICTEFCGVAHAQMYGKVHIMPVDAWRKWMAARRIQAQKQVAQGGPAATNTSGKASPTNQGTQGNISKNGKPNGVSYTADIYPIFQNHCAACHMNGQKMGGLNLASYATLNQGGSTAAGGPVNGPVLVPNSHAQSYLWDVVAGTDLRGGQKMPLGGPYLSQADVNKIASWIDNGAKNN